MSTRTRRQRRILHREFLFRVIDRELLSTHGAGDASRLLIQIAAFIIVLGIVFALFARIFSLDLGSGLRLTYTWSAQHLLIATTMLIVGLLAVLGWDNMFPDRRDVLTLGPLPVSTRTIFTAKLLAAGTTLGATVLCFHLVGGLVWPYLFNAETSAFHVPTLTSEPPIAPVDAAGLQTVLEQDLAAVRHSGRLADGAAGIAVGVSTHGVRRVLAFGAARTDSIFEIGSVSKTFTGLLLAHLIEDGRVTLEQPVRELLPQVASLRPFTTEITLLDLVTHRSGLPDMPPAFRGRRPTSQSVVDMAAAYDGRQLEHYLFQRGFGKSSEPSYRYSNLGISVLGHALATRAERDYPTLLRELVAEPLGLADTVVRVSSEQRRRLLPGHDSELEPAPFYEFDALVPPAGIRSTASDLLTLLEAHLHPERLPGGPLQRALITTHRIRTTAPDGRRMALGWFLPTHAVEYSHNGATAGFTADAFFSPEDDTALVVLSNVGPLSVVSADLISAHIHARLKGTPPVAIADVVVPRGGGARALVRQYAAYWVTMFAASLFIFAAIAGIQGVAASLLPRRAFLRVSSLLQMTVFGTIVSVYCLQPIIVSADPIVRAQQPGWSLVSPTYWFLGLFQWLAGVPLLQPLAHRALWALGLALALAAGGYALSYYRVLRKIAEEPDVLPGAARSRRLPPLGDQRQTAIAHFAIRTLLRSAPQRLMMAFYLGLGFAVVILFLKTPRGQSAAISDNPWLDGGVPMILSSLLMLAFAIAGGRVAFAIPKDLRANWIFRIVPLGQGREIVTARRRSLHAVAVAPAVAVWAAVCFAVWPWPMALAHVAVLWLTGALLVELAIADVPKIPFTSAYLPGRSLLHVRVTVLFMLVLPLTYAAAREEWTLLQHPATAGALVAAMAAVWLALRTLLSLGSNAERKLPAFDEPPPDAVTTLNLLYR